MAKAGNSFVEPEKIQNFVERLDNEDKELLSLRGSYMADCKAVREDIKTIYDEAADAGIPKKSLKAVMKAREAEKKAKAARDDLADIDLQHKFDAIRRALGDYSETPLGEAALAKATPNGATAQA